MATVDRSPRPASPGAKTSVVRRRRWWWALGLIALLYALPLVVAKTPLLNSLLAWAAPVKGQVRCGSAWLDWFSGISLGQLEVRDERGELVAQVESIELDRSLSGLLLGGGNLGHVAVRRPVVHLAIREQGSNLEDALEPWLKKKPAGADDPLPAIHLEVQDAEVKVRDEVGRTDHELRSLQVAARVGQPGAAPLELSCTGAIRSGGRESRFKIQAQAQPEPAGKSPLGQGKLHVDVAGLPLELTQPLLRRRLAGAKISGLLTAKLDGQWGAAAKQATLQGEIRARNLVLAADALGTDRLRLAEVRMPCQLTSTGERLDIRSLGIESDVGHLRLSGQVRLPELADALLVGLARQRLQATGRLDLAALAALLPETLSLKEDTEITGGEVTFAVDSRSSPQGHAWTGTVQARDLTALSGQREVAWREPLAASFALRARAAQWELEQLRCESSFLAVQGAGTLDRFTARAEYDWGMLVQELSQFVDWEDVTLAGNGRADLTWNRAADGRFALTAQLDNRGLVLDAPGRHPWREDHLVVDATAQGAWQEGSVRRLERAELQLRGTADELRARLIKPVADTTRETATYDVSWQGALAAWLPRMELLADLHAWELQGEGELTARCGYSPQGLAVDEATFRGRNVRLRGPGLFLDEPELVASAQLHTDTAQSKLRVERGQLTAGSLSVRLDEADVAWGPQPGATARLKYSADLAQLGRWLRDPRAPATWTLAGQLAGEATLARAGEAIQARWNSQVQQFELASLPPARPAVAPAPARPGRRALAAAATAAAAPPAAPARWREPALSLEVSARYAAATGLLRIENASLQSQALKLAAAGSVNLGDQPELDLKGTLSYDWQQLAPLWHPYLGNELQVTGRESRPIVLGGPLPRDPRTGAISYQRLTGQAALGWTGADLFGLSISPGEVAAQLDQGRVAIRPLQLAVGEGRLTLAPQITLDPQTALSLPRGPALSQVRITPEVCARGLKFLAPVLAQAAEAEGRFSIDLDGARVPLASPQTGDVAGRLAIHSVQVQPGPLAQEIILLVRQIDALAKRKVPNLETPRDVILSLQDQNVDFRMVEGRVYHRNLQFQVSGVTVQTHGSVGLDESLALMVEVPVQEAWLKNLPALANLQGQNLQFPVSGTVGRPKVDLRGLKQLNAQLIRNTARGVLLDQLNKQLDRLAPPANDR